MPLTEGPGEGREALVEGAGEEETPVRIAVTGLISVGSFQVLPVSACREEEGRRRKEVGGMREDGGERREEGGERGKEGGCMNLY